LLLDLGAKGWGTAESSLQFFFKFFLLQVETEKPRKDYSPLLKRGKGKIAGVAAFAQKKGAVESSFFQPKTSQPLCSASLIFHIVASRVSGRVVNLKRTLREVRRRCPKMLGVCRRYKGYVRRPRRECSLESEFSIGDTGTYGKSQGKGGRHY